MWAVIDILCGWKISKTNKTGLRNAEIEANNINEFSLLFFKVDVTLGLFVCSKLTVWQRDLCCLCQYFAEVFISWYFQKEINVCLE